MDRFCSSLSIIWPAVPVEFAADEIFRLFVFVPVSNVVFPADCHDEMEAELVEFARKGVNTLE